MSDSRFFQTRGRLHGEPLDSKRELTSAAGDLDVVASNLTGDDEGLSAEDCAEICADISALLRLIAAKQASPDADVVYSTDARTLERALAEARAERADMKRQRDAAEDAEAAAKDEAATLRAALEAIRDSRSDSAAFLRMEARAALAKGGGL